VVPRKSLLGGAGGVGGVPGILPEALWGVRGVEPKEFFFELDPSLVGIKPACSETRNLSFGLVKSPLNLKVIEDKRIALSAQEGVTRLPMRPNSPSILPLIIRGILR